MVTPRSDDITSGLIESGIEEMRRADRWRLAAVLSLALNLALAGWVWSWVIAPGVQP